MFKLGILFHLAICDKNVLGVKNTQACDITVIHRYYNMEFTFSSIVIIFVLAVALPNLYR